MSYHPMHPHGWPGGTARPQPMVVIDVPPSQSQRPTPSTTSANHIAQTQPHNYTQRGQYNPPVAFPPAQLSHLPNLPHVNGQHHAASALSRTPVTHVLPPQTQPSVDYRQLLLVLSEVYLHQAYHIAPSVALGKVGSDAVTYERLIAISLACIQSVLQNFPYNDQPRSMALLQLRYACLLYNETEDSRDAQEILSKALALCELNRLDTMRHNIELFLAQVTYKSNVSAAFKRIEAENAKCFAAKLYARVFACRFLQVDMCVRSGNPRAWRSALRSLQEMQELARSCGEGIILAVAATMESWLHLVHRSPTSLLDTQTALAVARAQSAMLHQLPQVNTLILLIDLASSLEPFDAQAATRKMQVLSDFIESQDDASWHAAGLIRIPFQSLSDDCAIDNASNLLTTSPTGGLAIEMSWLSLGDTTLLCYLLSASALYSKNSADGHKAEKILSDGIRMAEDSYQQDEPQSPQSIHRAYDRRSWRKILQCYMLIEKTLCQCNRSDWRRASESLQQLNQLLSLQDTSSEANLSSLVLYLNGIVHHSRGEVDAAYAKYMELLQQHPMQPEATSIKFEQRLSLLATMQILLMVHQPSHPHHHTAQQLLSLVSEHFPQSKNTTANQNPHLAGLYALVMSVYPPQTTSSLPQQAGGARSQFAILPTKATLQRALDLGQKTGNSLVMTAVMSYVHKILHTGIVNDNVVQGARVARHMAKEAGSAMWMAVGNGVLAELHEKNGMPGEAPVFRDEGYSLASRMAPAIKQVLNRPPQT